MSRVVAGGRLMAAALAGGIALLVLFLVVDIPSAPPLPAAPYLAYVGPGAGFAFLGSFLSLLTAFLVGAASILAWPIRVVWRSLSGKQGWKHAKVRKVIFLGLDGYDPDLAERYMGEGKLPNLAGLRDTGTYRRLRTTYPPLSPVAWSTFATGVNPAKHSLYDFLNRSMKTYLPELASSRVREPSRFLRLGKWRIPLGKASVEMRRKSKTFWSILGDQGIDSSVIRVPITFPPEKFNGRMLSAMCTPDLLGTQGSFQQFTTAGEAGYFDEAGQRRPLTRNGKGFKGAIEGPPNPLKDESGPMTAAFTLQINGAGSGKLHVNGSRYDLKPGEYTPWIRLTFRAAPGVKIEGIARFLLTETEPNVSLYVTPINIDPEKPALPISHPSYYATYLAKLLGAYSTLGMAEDTWALNERVIDEDAFLDQAYSICGEREAMFHNALDKTKKGIVACVFDTSDRVQHMFYRYLEPDHPAHQRNPYGNGAAQYENVIEDLYQRMDTIVGKALKHVDKDTVFFVLSDHGFKSFQRGVNLNAWLLQNGYLALKDDATEAGPYLKGVDWSRTRAYTFGLAGVYLNQKGREAQGVVAKSEAAALTREISDKLSGLRDGERDQVAIREAWPKQAVYKGPYMDAAPDIIIGYANGYRSSWDAALGKVTAEVFQDNLKAWSGDHCVDPALVPGVIFCNRKFENDNPGIEDLAPTTLGLFGQKVPAYMDGKDLFPAAQET